VRLAASRGFQDPIPLVQSTEGWVASSDDKSFESSVLLGRILVRPPPSLYQSSLHRSSPNSSTTDNASVADDLESSVTYYNAGLAAAASYQSPLGDKGSLDSFSSSGKRIVRGEIEMSPLR
jgi:hypothetical protein